MNKLIKMAENVLYLRVETLRKDFYQMHLLKIVQNTLMLHQIVDHVHQIRAL